MVADPNFLDERAENARLRAALASALAELAATRTELAALVELATRAQQQRDAADARTSECQTTPEIDPLTTRGIDPPVGVYSAAFGAFIRPERRFSLSR